MTDDELVERALAELAASKRPILGISERVLRLWRERVRAGESLELRGPSRVALRRYLAGDSGAGTVDYWRGVANSAEKMARALADMLASELSEPVYASVPASKAFHERPVDSPAPASDLTNAKAAHEAAVAAVVTPPAADAPPARGRKRQQG